jgi:hypothetical protein
LADLILLDVALYSNVVADLVLSGLSMRCRVRLVASWVRGRPVPCLLFPNLYLRIGHTVVIYVSCFLAMRFSCELSILSSALVAGGVNSLVAYRRGVASEEGGLGRCLV